MNSIYRNFIITLKVNKMAATLNICGLVIAFTLFDSVAIRTESELLIKYTRKPRLFIDWIV